MSENELPKEQTKEINGIALTSIEISKIAMICDYLVLDRFNDISSFFRFEKCFGPLLSKENPNFLIEAFQEICGPKKKIYHIWPFNFSLHKMEKKLFN